MAGTTADILVDTLIDYGVDTVFGIPGDGVNGIIEAFRKQADAIRFIQVRHEESAAFAACAWAKFTGRLGVCVATSGPGGIHLLNGLYDAKLDQQPVLAITGLQFHDLVGTHTQQDVALDKLFMDVAKFNERVNGPAHMENLAPLACRTALAYRGVAHLTIPVDVQDWTMDEVKPSKRERPGYNTALYARSARMPDEADIRAAADVLNEGERIVILAGQGALHATDELERLADKLGAVIVKALLGKAAVPDDSPFTTGQIGLLGTAPSQNALMACDTILFVGSSFPYLEYLPPKDQARGLQIDIDPMRLGLRFPIEVGLVGDSAKTLDALLPLVRRRSERPFLERAQAEKAEWDRLMETRGTSRETPMDPQVLAWELGRRLDDAAIVTCDSGTIATWWARQIPAKRGQLHSLSGNLATMAPGLPYAIAAQVAFPDRQVVAFVGDGGFSMLMADFVTAVKYNLPIKVVICNNRALGQIKWEQMVFLGNPEYVCDLAPIDFARFAEACGGKGYTVTDPATCGEAIQLALNTPGPVIVDAIVNPHIPPMPPHIKPGQAWRFAEALARGTPARGEIIRSVAGQRIREMI